MTPTAIVLAMLTTAAVSLLLAATLFGIKLLHRRRLELEDARRERYVTALGDFAGRNAVPETTPRDWADDPVFHAVLFDYISIVTGQERDALDELIDALDLRTLLSHEVRRRGHKSHRVRALTYLVEIANEKQQELFVECLADPVAEIRLHAARGLAVIGDESSVPRLLDLLQHETLWNTGRLADILVGFGPAAVPALTDFIAEAITRPPANADVMREVIRAVGLIGSLEAEPVLLEMLDASEPMLRLGAASALADCGTPACVPALIRALLDTDWRVRSRAADALGTFADPRSVDPLIASLRDHSWWVRQNSAKALAEMPDGVTYLAEALNDEDPFMRDAAAHQLGTKKVIRAARQRIEAGIATPLDQRLYAAAIETLEELLDATPGEPTEGGGRVADGDEVVERLKAFDAESTFQLVKRLRRLRRAITSGGRRFPGFRDAGGSGPYLSGGAGGGGFRPVGGKYTNLTQLQREEKRVRSALERALTDGSDT